MTNRIRRLILDDNPERHAWARSAFPRDEVVSVWTYFDLIAQLELAAAGSTAPWDFLHLDHDLADLVAEVQANAGKLPDAYPASSPYGGSEMPYDGRDVVAWLVRNPTKCPRHIAIHSWADEAATMERVLLNAI